MLTLAGKFVISALSTMFYSEASMMSVIVASIKRELIIRERHDKEVAAFKTRKGCLIARSGRPTLQLGGPED